MKFTVFKSYDEARKTAKANKWVSRSRIGEVDTSYDELVQLFGEITYENSQTDAGWIVHFEDGNFADIYDYKIGMNYMGKYKGISKEKIRDWHIGGDNRKVVQYIEELLNKQRKN